MPDHTQRPLVFSAKTVHLSHRTTNQFQSPSITEARASRPAAGPDGGCVSGINTILIDYTAAGWLPNARGTGRGVLGVLAATWLLNGPRFLKRAPCFRTHTGPLCSRELQENVVVCQKRAPFTTWDDSVSHSSVGPQSHPRDFNSIPAGTVHTQAAPLLCSEMGADVWQQHLLSDKFAGNICKLPFFFLFPSLL